MKRRLVLILSLVAGLAAGLFGYALIDRSASGIDPDQSRTCRSIVPALNPGGIIALDRIVAGRSPNTLRIDYRTGTGEPDISRTVICLFAGRGLDRQKGELVGLATEAGPMPEASFYFLRRFYLETADAVLNDPGGIPLWDVPQVPIWAAYGMQQLVSALPSAAVLALLAASYALIYGLIGRIMLGFGEFAALGSIAGVVAVAGTLSLAVSTPLIGVAIALIVALATSALHGFAIGRVALAKLRTASGQHVLIATVGMSIALSEYLRIMQGTETRWLPPVFNTPWPIIRHGSFVATTTPVVLGSGILGLAAAAALVLYLKKSDYGRSWRAIADDARMAELMGVNQQAIYDRAVILACACAAAAGIIVTVIFGGLGFAGGFALGLKALVAAVLGGIGSVGGAALGGLCIALLEAVWSATMPIEARDIVVFSLLAFVLILRPGGFFGDGELKPREV